MPAQALKSGGVVSILAYIGHPGGQAECDVLRAFAADLARNAWTTSEARLLNRAQAPVLLSLWKH